MKNVLLKKILSISLIVVIAIGAAVGGWFLWKEYFSQAAAGVNLSLDPAKKTVNIGETIDAKVLVNTASKEISGFQFHVTYDKSKFSATIDDSGSLMKKKNSRGDQGIWLIKDIENGVIKGNGGLAVPYNGSEGLLATIKFKALASVDPSSDNVKFDKSNSRVHENIPGKAPDILNSVDNARYTVAGEEGGGVERNATLALAPAKTTHNKGDSFDVKLKVNTGGEEISGFQAYISYPKDEFSVALSNSGSLMEKKNSNGDKGIWLYHTAEDGLIKLNGGLAVPYKGTDGLLVTLKLKGKIATDPQSDNFVFNQSKAAVYANVVGQAPDILKSVTNGRYAITTTEVQDKPETPINLKGEAGNTVIKWTWEAGTADTAATSAIAEIAGYRLYVGTESGSYGDPIDVGDAVTYTSTGLTNDTTYYAIVRAYNSNGDLSDPSNEANATPSGSKQWGGPGQPSEPSTGGVFDMPNSLIATGIVIASAVLVALIVSIIIWAVARKRKKKK